MPSGFSRYIAACSGNTYFSLGCRFLARKTNSSWRSGKMGMLTIWPVLAVLTEIKRFSKSNFVHSSKQQSPRRIAEHIPVIKIGRINSSVRAAFKIAANSSGEYGLRKIVSVSRVGTFENGLIAPIGSRCLKVVRNSLSVSFQVLAVTPRLDSASRNDCAAVRVT